MKILKTLIVALVALIALALVVSFFLPSTAHVEREAVIDAPPSTVFALLNSFRRFNDWSPWAGVDPATAYVYEGPEMGVGARMAWESDHPDVGVGSQEITLAIPHERIETTLDFGPQGTADAFFALAAEGGGTRVAWGFDTDFGMNPIGRYFGLFMEGMLGADYEKGLASLKELAESLPKADFSDLPIELTEVEAQSWVYVSGESTQDSAAIGQALGEAYGQVMTFLASHGLEPAGPPLTVNRVWDDGRFEFDAGMQLATSPATEASDDSAVKMGTTYAGKVIRAVHQGSYDGLPATYEKLEAYVAVHGWEMADAPWDAWVSDPESTPEEELITHIYFPISDG